MDEKTNLENSEENIYEEIATLAHDINDNQHVDNTAEEPFSLLHGISEGRRETIRNYALADWDFEQQFQNIQIFEEKNTPVSVEKDLHINIFICTSYHNNNKKKNVYFFHLYVSDIC